MEEYEKLFKEISNLKEKHKKEDLFNGFMSFGVGADETKHSKFIGNLLNPKGSHKQGDKFLNLFLKHLEITDFNFDGLNVECEKYADGRYIDIAIWNKTQFIVIENKFWASDQDNQLRDYYNFALTHTKNKFENVFMLYLTPYGRQPFDNSFSVGLLPEGIKVLPREKVKCISYEKHVLEWLEACIDSFDANDIIRLNIILEMYIELIRNVINRDKYMEEIMSKFLSNSENMKLAIDIVMSFQQRNFLGSVDTREFILKQIDAAIYRHNDPKLDFDQDPDNDILYFTLEIVNENPSIENTKIGDICFSGVHIYGQKLNGEEVKDNQIVCNDINDINLYSILTNNIDGIDKWLKSIVNELLNKGEAENQTE